MYEHVCECVCTHTSTHVYMIQAQILSSHSHLGHLLSCSLSIPGSPEVSTGQRQAPAHPSRLWDLVEAFALSGKPLPDFLNGSLTLKWERLPSKPPPSSPLLLLQGPSSRESLWIALNGHACSSGALLCHFAVEYWSPLTLEVFERGWWSYDLPCN